MDKSVESNKKLRTLENAAEKAVEIIKRNDREIKKTEMAKEERDSQLRIAEEFCKKSETLLKNMKKHSRNSEKELQEMGRECKNSKGRLGQLMRFADELETRKKTRNMGVDGAVS